VSFHSGVSLRQGETSTSCPAIETLYGIVVFLYGALTVISLTGKETFDIALVRLHLTFAAVEVVGIVERTIPCRARRSRRLGAVSPRFHR